tara:strand:+ start:1235 stop:2068 length:834 start_codon:yes stop_codon:yes gene_type:complete
MNNLLQSIFKYYNKCWDVRFLNGHNHNSNACHYGFYNYNCESETLDDYDKQKINTNIQLIDKIEKTEDDSLNILDAGCGYGGTIIHLAKYFNKSFIYGITLTDAQINISINNVINNNIDNILIHEGNFDYPNYNIKTTQKFDIIYFIESICHAECKENTINFGLEMMNKGGKMIIFDYFENLDIDGYVKNKDLIRNGMAIPSFINVDVFENIKYDKINIDDVTENILPGMKYSKEKAEKKIKNESDIDIKNHLESCIEMYELHNKRVLKYNIVVLTK